VSFHDNLSAAEVARALQRIEQTIRDRHPEAKRVFIEAAAVTRATPEMSPAGAAHAADE
jgi:hypothetical protein